MKGQIYDQAIFAKTRYVGGRNYSRGCRLGLWRFRPGREQQQRRLEQFEWLG
jgi:hypothetical protein